MFKDIYRPYFRKAGPFLYPLLNLPRNEKFTSAGVFTALDDCIKKEDRKLIYTFDHTTPGFMNYADRMHKAKPNFLEEIIISEEITALVYDFSEFEETWQAYLEGKYSKFSEHHKKLILKYFNYNRGNVTYLSSYLYPEKFFDQYAKILDVEVDLLQVVGELCDKPNFEEEHLKTYATHALVA
jgi:hypothetical protein